MEIHYQRIGERIREARRLRGMSIGELANRIALSERSVAFVENGQAKLDVEILLPICTALDVTPNDLLEGEYACTRGQPLAEQVRLQELEELLCSLRGEPTEKKNQTVIRDAETVIAEMQKMVLEYAQAEKQAADCKTKKKKFTHW